MAHLAAENKLDWQIDSAGTGGWHVGEGPDKRSVRTAHGRGVDISKQVCRKFSPKDFEEFDHIYVMDKNNLSDVLAMAPSAQAANKVKLLLGDKEVPDPYYDDTQFEPVFDMIEGSCKDIVKKYSSR